MFYNNTGFKKFAVLVLIAETDGRYNFVFEKRAKGITQSSEICFPGGKIEPKESGRNAALRETQEELGIKKENIEIKKKLQTLIVPNGMIIYPFVGLTKILPDINNINHDEVEEVFTIPLNYFLQNKPTAYKAAVKLHPWIESEDSKIDRKILLPSAELGLPSSYHNAWGDFTYEILVYNTLYGTVWGITAKLILNTIKKFEI